MTTIKCAVLFLFPLTTPAFAQWASCSGGPAGSLCLSSGNVGIGTTSPSGAAVVVQRSGASMNIQSDSTHALAMGSWDGTFQHLTSINLGVDLTPLQLEASSTQIHAPYVDSYPLVVRNGSLKDHDGVSSPPAHYVGLLISTSESSNPLLGGLILHPSPTAGNRYMEISTSEGSTFHNIALLGKVGIGTTAPCGSTAPSGCALSVNGGIQAKEVVVNTGWSDYVFDPGYHLQPMSEVAAYVKENHHLPDIPSAQDVAEKGVSLGEMQSKLLSKIEELTLHMIDIENENHDLRRRVQQLEKDGQ